MRTRIFRTMACMFFLLTTSSAYPENLLKTGAVSFSNGYTLHVEMADTETLRESGLMHRTALAENAGMLFVYPDEDIRGVWMKNTLLALDVLFLSESGKIASMLPNLQPCRHDPCPVYSSKRKARYMLEVNAGFIDRHRIKLDQDVMLDYQHDTQ